MTATALTTTALIGALAALPAATVQTDFTGVWVLDTSRSEGVQEGIAQTMKVEQSGDRIEIEFHLITPEGEQRVTDVYVLDGNETDYRPPIFAQVSATGKRTSRWSEGRSGFESTERATIQAPDGEITITAERKWTLAPDGNTLTIEMTSIGPQGEMKSTRVFTRQQPAGERWSAHSVDCEAEPGAPDAELRLRA